MGLGYGSDGDSQDSGKSPQAHKPRAVKLESALSGQAVRAVSAAVLEDQAEAGKSMSPSTAVGGWVKDEEKADSVLGFVKGQRWVVSGCSKHTFAVTLCILLAVNNTALICLLHTMFARWEATTLLTPL